MKNIQKILLLLMMGLMMPLGAFGLTLQPPKATTEEKATRIQIPVDEPKIKFTEVKAQKNIVYFDIESAYAKKSRMFIYVQSSTVVKVVVSQYQTGANPMARVVLFFAPGVKITQAKRAVQPIVKDGNIEMVVAHDLAPAPKAPVTAAPEKPEAKPEPAKVVPPSAQPQAVDTTIPSVDTVKYVPPSEPAKPVAKEPRVKREPTKIKVTKYKPIETPVTASFTDAELSNVIRTLAAQCGLNVYAAFRMNVKVSLDVKDEPVGKVFKDILNANGYTYELLGENTLKIIEIKEGMPEYAPAADILPTKVYTVNFYKAPEVKEAIDKLLKNTAPPKIAPGMAPVSSHVTAVTSILAVTAPPEVLKQVDELVKQAENKKE
jgi:hypothetical protein